MKTIDNTVSGARDQAVTRHTARDQAVTHYTARDQAVTRYTARDQAVTRHTALAASAGHVRSRGRKQRADILLEDSTFTLTFILKIATRSLGIILLLVTIHQHSRLNT